MEAPRTRSQVGRGDGVPLHPRGPVPQLYDRREDRVTLDEVVKINIRRVRINRQGVEGESPLR